MLKYPQCRPLHKYSNKVYWISSRDLTRFLFEVVINVIAEYIFHSLIVQYCKAIANTGWRNNVAKRRIQYVL